MDRATLAAATKLAPVFGVPLPNLLAIIETESLGVVFARITHPDGSTTDEPVIRWEGHYFDKRLTAAQRGKARALGLAASAAGAIKNPSKQQDRWDKLLRPALDLNLEAAIQSVSWGVGQVMGAHWDKLGYDNPATFMHALRSGAEGQVDCMLRYCKVFGLIDELQRGDFAGFARGYNGPNFRKYSYDTKMAKAAKKYAGSLTGHAIVADPKAAKAAGGMTRMGVEGAKPREVQALLRRAGYAVDIDGDFGPATKKAVMAFQKAHHLDVDGIVGPQTWQALEAFKVDPQEMPGVPGPAEALVATPEGRQGTAIGGAGLSLATAQQAVDGATQQIGVVSGQLGFLDKIYSALLVISALLVVAGIIWAGYGWWKANRTKGVNNKSTPIADQELQEES